MSVDDLTDEDLSPKDLREELREASKRITTLTVGNIVREELTNMKIKNWRAYLGIETIDDVIRRLIIRYRKSEALGEEKLHELGLTPASEFYEHPPPAIDLEEVRK
jgi:hypothetical protein